MTQEEILEGNELIAEFMNVEISCYTSYSEESRTCYHINDIKYDSSWDWLFPILERIEALGYRWEIGMSAISPYHYCKIWSIGKIEGISSLDVVYGAVIEFIKFYNQNKEV